MYQIKNYPDGSSYVVVNEFLQQISFRINSYNDLWTLKQIKDVYDYNHRNLSVVIPNLLDAQADRRFNSNEPHGLKLVCEFINSLKFDRVWVFHPHNPEVVESLIDNITIIDNKTFINQVLCDIFEKVSVDVVETNLHGLKIAREFRNTDQEGLILMSSDAGGFKPLMKLADSINWKGETFSANKSRKYVDGKSILNQEIYRDDFNGKDILIVDDICVYGGTFKGLSKLLRERNCGKIYLAVSHMTVQNLGKDPVTNYFDGVWATNSKYSEYFMEGKDENIPLKNLIIKNLFK